MRHEKGKGRRMKRTWSPARLVSRPYCLITTAKEWAVGWMAALMSTIRLDRSERINSTYVSNARKEKGKIQVFIIGLVTECEVCSGAETLVWRRSLWAYRRGCLFYFIFSPLPL